MRNVHAAEGTKDGFTINAVRPFVFDATIAENGQGTVLKELRSEDVRKCLSKLVKQICCILVCENDADRGSKYNKNSKSMLTWTVLHIFMNLPEHTANGSGNE